jgi:hypothetical protein
MTNSKLKFAQNDGAPPGDEFRRRLISKFRHEGIRKIEVIKRVGGIYIGERCE